PDRVVGSWGSPVHADGRLYITDQHGCTLVFAAGPNYEHLATNRLGEHTNASIAVSGGDLFIRTHKHLWCIGQKKEPKEQRARGRFPGCAPREARAHVPQARRGRRTGGSCWRPPRRWRPGSPPARPGGLRGSDSWRNPALNGPSVRNAGIIGRE